MFSPTYNRLYFMDNQSLVELAKNIFGLQFLKYKLSSNASLRLVSRVIWHTIV